MPPPPPTSPEHDRAACRSAIRSTIFGGVRARKTHLCHAIWHSKSATAIPRTRCSNLTAESFVKPPSFQALRHQEDRQFKGSVSANVRRAEWSTNVQFICARASQERVLPSLQFRWFEQNSRSCFLREAGQRTEKDQRTADIEEPQFPLAARPAGPGRPTCLRLPMSPWRSASCRPRRRMRAVPVPGGRCWSSSPTKISTNNPRNLEGGRFNRVGRPTAIWIGPARSPSRMAQDRAWHDLLRSSRRAR